MGSRLRSKIQNPLNHEKVFEFYQLSNTTEPVNNWVRNMYQDRGVAQRIVKMESGFVALQDFLQEECYSDVARAILKDTISWERVGPCHLYDYEVADEATLPPQLQKLKSLLESRTFLKLLQMYSPALKVRMRSENTPTVVVEFQKRKNGCYSHIFYNKTAMINGETSEEKAIDNQSKMSTVTPKTSTQKGGEELKGHSDHSDDSDQWPTADALSISSQSAESSSPPFSSDNSLELDIEVQAGKSGKLAFLDAIIPIESTQIPVLYMTGEKTTKVPQTNNCLTLIELEENAQQLYTHMSCSHRNFSYSHLVHLEWLKPGELVAVEVNPISFTEKLPPALNLRSFASS